MEIINKIVVTLLPCYLISCTTPVKVGPKPQIVPIIESNVRTQKAIKTTGQHITKIRETQKLESATLQSVMDDLNKLLSP